MQNGEFLSLMGKLLDNSYTKHAYLCFSEPYSISHGAQALDGLWYAMNQAYWMLYPVDCDLGTTEDLYWNEEPTSILQTELQPPLPCCRSSLCLY